MNFARQIKELKTDTKVAIKSAGFRTQCYARCNKQDRQFLINGLRTHDSHLRQNTLLVLITAVTKQ